MGNGLHGPVLRRMNMAAVSAGGRLFNRPRRVSNRKQCSSGREMPGDPSRRAIPVDPDLPRGCRLAQLTFDAIHFALILHPAFRASTHLPTPLAQSSESLLACATNIIVPATNQRLQFTVVEAGDGARFLCSVQFRRPLETPASGVMRFWPVLGISVATRGAEGLSPALQQPHR